VRGGGIRPTKQGLRLLSGPPPVMGFRSRGTEGSEVRGLARSFFLFVRREVLVDKAVKLRV
jgi:hypothetical protein